VTNQDIGPGEGVELALPGDMIRKRHIATRASNRRQIIVLTEGDAEFVGYSIGLDDQSLQLLEIPSGEVSSISLDHIVSITDGKLFTDLPRPEKDIVDRRTASFRKTSHAWLVTNWPNVYDQRGEADAHRDRPREEPPPREPAGNEQSVRQEYEQRRIFEDGYSKARDRAGSDRGQG